MLHLIFAAVRIALIVWMVEFFPFVPTTEIDFKFF